MDMEVNDFSKIKEASYLTAENATRYRIILSFFYREHERMKDLLYPADIFQFARSVKGMEAYTDAMLEQDLATLVSWNNIIPRQEMKEPKSIEDYKRKRFRYQITPYTLAFERMLDDLAKKGEDFGGLLEKSTFVRLLKAIQEMSVPKDGEQTAYECWQEVLHHFKKIKTNTSDYIGYLNSEKLESNMQTEAFLVYKDKFVNYLRDFVMALQQTAMKIQSALNETSEKTLAMTAQAIIDHDKAIPRIGGPELDEAAVSEDFYETWKNIRTWFINNEAGESEYTSLQRQTNEAIRRITRIIQRFGERLQQHRSRKKDYLRIAGWFEQCETLDEAHQLSATVFGLFGTRHYAVEPSETNNVYADLWLEKPTEYKISPRVQGYREKTRPSAFTMNDEAKQKARQDYLDRIRQLEKSLFTYVEDGKIVLSHHAFIGKNVRKVLLRWIAKAGMQESGRVQTEFGVRVAVAVDPNRRVVIRSEDGTMEMPDMTYTFEGHWDQAGK